MNIHSVKQDFCFQAVQAVFSLVFPNTEMRAGPRRNSGKPEETSSSALSTFSAINLFGVGRPRRAKLRWSYMRSATDFLKGSQSDIPRRIFRRANVPTEMPSRFAKARASLLILTFIQFLRTLPAASISLPSIPKFSCRDRAFSLAVRFRIR
jgi:hypothetical protein